MTKANYETTEFGGMADDVTRAIGDLSCDQICELRNQLVSDQLAFHIGEGDFKVYSIADIETWAASIELTYENRLDVDGCPWHYELNGWRSEERYLTEREAMYGAFEDVVVNNADISNYDLFTCQKCDGHFDIEDSVQMSGDELYCEQCATKANK